MRLDPIFVVAPVPPPPSMPTRRAFLLAGATFTLGTAVGGACGYSIAAKQEAVETEELASSGDVELDELRRLAVKAPIAELVERRLVFLNSLTKDYRKDEVLWRGVDRLAAAVLVDLSFPDRRVSARLIAQVIDLADPPFQARYAESAKKLRAVR